MAEQGANDVVVLGRIVGLHGVRGWVKVYSYTQPREKILDYTPWLLALNGASLPRAVKTGRMQGKGVVAQLEACADRDEAAALVGAEIRVRGDQLQQAGPDEYYWKDLVGLAVENRDGLPLGQIVALMETGANDVLVVHGTDPVTEAVTERLIPYVAGVIVTEVDIAARRMVVDWDADF